MMSRRPVAHLPCGKENKDSISCSEYSISCSTHFEGAPSFALERRESVFCLPHTVLLGECLPGSLSLWMPGISGSLQACQEE